MVTPIKQAQTMGYHFESKVIDLTNLELEMGKMMEQGPVLIITFQTQQIMCVKDSKGKVVEGDPVCFIYYYYWIYNLIYLFIPIEKTGENYSCTLCLGTMPGSK